MQQFKNQHNTGTSLTFSDGIFIGVQIKHDDKCISCVHTNTKLRSRVNGPLGRVCTLVHWSYIGAINNTGADPSTM